MLLWLNLFHNNLKKKVLKLEIKISDQNNILDYIAHEVRTSIHGVTSTVYPNFYMKTGIKLAILNYVDKLL